MTRQVGGSTPSADTTSRRAGAYPRTGPSREQALLAGHTHGRSNHEPGSKRHVRLREVAPDTGRHHVRLYVPERAVAPIERHQEPHFAAVAARGREHLLDELPGHVVVTACGSIRDAGAVERLCPQTQSGGLLLAALRRLSAPLAFLGCGWDLRPPKPVSLGFARPAPGGQVLLAPNCPSPESGGRQGLGAGGTQLAWRGGHGGELPRTSLAHHFCAGSSEQSAGFGRRSEGRVLPRAPLTRRTRT